MEIDVNWIVDAKNWGKFEWWGELEIEIVEIEMQAGDECEWIKEEEEESGTKVVWSNTLEICQLIKCNKNKVEESIYSTMNVHHLHVIGQH